MAHWKQLSFCPDMIKFPLSLRINKNEFIYLSDWTRTSRHSDDLLDTLTHCSDEELNQLDLDSYLFVYMKGNAF